MNILKNLTQHHVLGFLSSPQLRELWHGCPAPVLRSQVWLHLGKKGEFNDILFVSFHIEKRLFTKQILKNKWKFSYMSWSRTRSRSRWKNNRNRNRSKMDRIRNTAGTMVLEPEPPGAGVFGWSRSPHFQLIYSRKWYGINCTVHNVFWCLSWSKK